MKVEVQFLADVPEVIPAIARQQQFSHLYLWTWSANRYYDKLGWSIIDSVHPKGFPQSLVMQKPLLINA
jgi:N-acetylglutamate synthase-like GNAT family acetyltransferase